MTYNIIKPIKRLLVQDARIERHVLISSCKSTKITTILNNHPQEGPGTYQNRYPMSKGKEEAALRWTGTITIKSSSIPTGWGTHKLETNSTKEVLPLLWMFGIPHQASQSGHLTKGLGIPRESDLEGQRDLIVRLLQGWGKQRLQSWRAQTKPGVHQDSEERSSDSVGNWTKTTC